jgi:hypothetical protein
VRVGVIQRLTIAALVVLGGSFTAQSEELILPFACAVEQGQPRLYPSQETHYKVIGQRDEQPFSSCGGNGNRRCETMMVHRFHVDCGGVRMSWARVAAAARSQGVAMPSNLPNGFAPVSVLAGRFVLPSLTRHAPQVTSVAAQDLSPDSVIDRSSSSNTFEEQPWTTVVRADGLLPVASSGAGRVGAMLMTLLLFLWAASMVAAGRWRIPNLSHMHVPTVLHDIVTRATASTTSGIHALRRNFMDGYDAWQKAQSDDDDGGVHQAAMMVQARLAQTELLVATLPDGLLLRDVLQSEIDRVRERAIDADKNARRRAPEKSAALFRAMMRELDRIGRIAESAAQMADAEPYEPQRTNSDAPRTEFEAYRILGLNSEAPPAVAKKLVDALRMSWHPDYARDESDRLRREDRMKQINAAWDMIKDRRAAA